MKLGMPPIDQPWTGADLSKAAKVLSEIARRHPYELPRMKSSKSGPVFARITSDENLDLLRDRAKPLRQRVPAAAQFLHAVSAIKKLYASEAPAQQPASDESTELLGLTLQVSMVINDLADEATATLDKKDPRVAALMLALTPVKETLSTRLQDAVAHVLTLQAKTPEAIDRMLGFVDATFPALVKATPPKLRQEILVKLQAVRDKPEFAAHKDKFDPILDKIRQAVQEANDE